MEDLDIQRENLRAERENERKNIYYKLEDRRREQDYQHNMDIKRLTDARRGQIEIDKNEKKAYNKKLKIEKKT